MSASEGTPASANNDAYQEFSALQQCALTSTPEAMRAVQLSIQGLASEPGLAELQPDDRKSAFRLLARLLDLSAGDTGVLLKFDAMIQAAYSASATDKQDAAEEDAQMEDAEDEPDHAVAKASLGGMNDQERPAVNPQDGEDNEESEENDNDQEIRLQTKKKQGDTSGKRKRKSGSRDAAYKSRQNSRKKQRRTQVTESQSKKDSDEEAGLDSDSSTNTEPERQGNSAHNAGKPLARPNMSSSAQKKANESPAAALGTHWNEVDYAAMCEAVRTLSEKQNWEVKVKDSGLRLICDLLLFSAAENIATNVVRFATSSVTSQRNDADPATSQAMAKHHKEPELISIFVLWSNFCTHVESLSEWGKLPQTAAMHAAYQTELLLERDIRHGNKELINFLQYQVPGVKPEVALKRYLTPRSPWGMSASSSGIHHQKMRAGMEYKFLEAFGGSAALLLCSKDTSLRSVLGNPLSVGQLDQLLSQIKPHAMPLHSLVRILDKHVWKTLVVREFQLPQKDVDLQPLIDALRLDGWDGAADAIIRVRGKVIEERAKVVQDEAMEGIEPGDDVDGAGSLLGGLGALDVGGDASEAEETAGGQSYFDEAMVSSGEKEKDIPDLDVRALNNCL